MIYGPGGYKTADFMRIGTPMQLVLWIISIIFISMDPSKWYLSWIITALVLFAVSGILVLDLKAFFSKYNPIHRKSDNHTS